MSAAFEAGFGVGSGIGVCFVACFLFYLLGLKERWWR